MVYLSGSEVAQEGITSVGKLSHSNSISHVSECDDLSVGIHKRPKINPHTSSSASNKSPQSPPLLLSVLNSASNGVSIVPINHNQSPVSPSVLPPSYSCQPRSLSPVRGLHRVTEDYKNKPTWAFLRASVATTLTISLLIAALVLYVTATVTKTYATVYYIDITSTSAQLTRNFANFVGLNGARATKLRLSDDKYYEGVEFSCADSSINTSCRNYERLLGLTDANCCMCSAAILFYFISIVVHYYKLKPALVNSTIMGGIMCSLVCAATGFTSSAIG